MKGELEKLQENTVRVHDFHVWSLSKGKYAFSSHIQCNGNAMEVLKQATKIVNDFGIDHATFQIEDASEMPHDEICKQEC